MMAVISVLFKGPESFEHVVWGLFPSVGAPHNVLLVTERQKNCEWWNTKFQF